MTGKIPKVHALPSHHYLWGSSHALTPPLAHASRNLAVLYAFTVPATKPVCGEVMFVRNFEISPTLLRDFLGHRLLMREQTS